MNTSRRCLSYGRKATLGRDDDDGCGHGVGRISRGGATRGFFQNFFGEQKVVKFGFSHSKLKKQPFLLKFSKSRVWPRSPPATPVPTPIVVFIERKLLPTHFLNMLGGGGVSHVMLLRPGRLATKTVLFFQTSFNAVIFLGK